MVVALAKHITGLVGHLHTPPSGLQLLINLINKHLIIDLIHTTAHNILRNLQLPRLQSHNHQTIQRLNLNLRLEVLHKRTDLGQDFFIAVAGGDLVVFVETVQQGEDLLFAVAVCTGLSERGEEVVQPGCAVGFGELAPDYFGDVLADGDFGVCEFLDEVGEEAVEV